METGLLWGEEKVRAFLALLSLILTLFLIGFGVVPEGTTRLLDDGGESITLKAK